MGKGPRNKCVSGLLFPDDSPLPRWPRLPRRAKGRLVRSGERGGKEEEKVEVEEGEEVMSGTVEGEVCRVRPLPRLLPSLPVLG